MSSIYKTDVLILGAGAAGLMCAAMAGRRGRSVTIVDHADRVGKKILISGGGHCNFTNRRVSAENFLSENPHFAKSALARYTPNDFIALVERYGIAYHEKTLGQLFCDRSSREIVAMLERECAEADAEVLTGIRIHSVRHDAGEYSFRIETTHGRFEAKSLVVATGGLSIPKMGATPLGYEIASQFGHRIVPCRPGLVPFVFNPSDLERWAGLAGVSADVIVRSTAETGRKRSKSGASFREKLLVTHRGLSGPAILQISSFWSSGKVVTIDLAPEQSVTHTLLKPNARRDTSAAVQAVRSILPARMAERWVALHHPEDWTNPSVAAFEADVHSWRVIPAGTEGYAKAEVTAGGVDTAELDARTMESRRVPGLFFIGEVVDMTGWLGGYNFQWAWASGASAGDAVSNTALT